MDVESFFAGNTAAAMARVEEQPGTNREALVEIVENFLTGLRDQDLTQVSFAPSVIFETPFTTELIGLEDILLFLDRFVPTITGVQIFDHIVEGQYCATLFNWETLYGTIPAFGRFRIVEGQLAEIRTFFNLRTLSEGLTRLSDQEN